MQEPLLIEMGIGWKRDPVKPGHLVSAGIADYVAEIERLRAISVTPSTLPDRDDITP